MQDLNRGKTNFRAKVYDSFKLQDSRKDESELMYAIATSSE